MAFFKRILNFNKETVARQEQRHAERYTLIESSPLSATLTLGGRRHPGRIVNLSSSGLSLRVEEPLETPRGTAGQIELRIDAHTLTTAVEIAHTQTGGSRTIFGIQLKFEDFDTKKSYLQLLEAVTIGLGLRAGDPQLVRDKEQGLITIHYHGPGDTQLTIWRKFVGQVIQGFEFRMHDYFVRSGAVPPQLEIFTSESQPAEHQFGYGAPDLQRSKVESAEILQLFHWVLPHLNQQMPDDVREFLREYDPLKS